VNECKPLPLAFTVNRTSLNLSWLLADLFWASRSSASELPRCRGLHSSNFHINSSALYGDRGCA